MARVQTFLPSNQTELNFNALYQGDSTFFDNYDISLAGHSYRDFSVVKYHDSDGYYVNLVTGDDLRGNDAGDVVSGTITGLFQAAGISILRYYDHMFMTGISISGTAFYRATTTSGTQDDQALIRKALAGNDRFDLGSFQDRSQGHGGNDLMYGNGGNDTLEGGAGADTVSGGAGRDQLMGGLGNDRLLGGADDDRLIGGAGQDFHIGGAGADMFVFTNVADLGTTGTQTDMISDFSGQDRIDLSRIDAVANQPGNQAFVFIGRDSIGQSASGEVSFQILNRPGTAYDVTVVSIDTDADRDAEAVIRLAGLHNLDASDFIL